MCSGTQNLLDIIVEDMNLSLHLRNISLEV